MSRERPRKREREKEREREREAKEIRQGSSKIQGGVGKRKSRRGKEMRQPKNTKEKEK